MKISPWEFVLLAVALAAMTVGCHDIDFPKDAILYKARWWLFGFGLIFYMNFWNIWDKIWWFNFSNDKENPRGFKLWWVSFLLRFPILAQIMIVSWRLSILFIFVIVAEFLLHNEFICKR